MKTIIKGGDPTRRVGSVKSSLISWTVAEKKEAVRLVKKITLLSKLTTFVNLVTVVLLISWNCGCEGSNSDNNNNNTTTNITNNFGGGGGGGSSSSSSSSSGGSGPANSSSSSNNTAPPPAVSNPEITVVNSSSHSVAVNGSAIGSGSSRSWNYSGSSTVTFDTLAGYSVSQTVSDGRSHIFNIHNSSSVPGTVEMSGKVE